LAAFLIAALLARLFLGRLIAYYLRKAAVSLDESVARTLRSLASWALVLIGVYYGASSLPWATNNPHVPILLARGLGVAWVLLALTGSLRIFNLLVTWQVRRMKERAGNARDISQQAILTRKVVNVLVWGIGLLYLMRTAGLDISPLLASGAIGGLAIALAAQDTLSNLFAGFYLTIDHPIRVGDFVRLESGQEGYVEEIGWRNTRVRLLPNNLVVIPNSKLSQTVITNYFLPEPNMSVYVPCGVSYDSDLDQVERVCVDLARKIQRTVPGADPEWEPVVRWKSFGDSAVNFITVLRAQQFETQFLIESEYIKALHKRFKQVGIEIPFPVRTIVMKSADEFPRDLKRDSLMAK
jgi:small-conductance mechanosensitive channel